LSKAPLQLPEASLIKVQLGHGLAAQILLALLQAASAHSQWVLRQSPSVVQIEPFLV
jgi:hypothetical protein